MTELPKPLSELYGELATHLGVSQDVAEEVLLAAFYEVILDPRFAEMLVARMIARVQN